MQQKVRFVAAYVASSPEAQKAVDKALRGKIIPDFVQHGIARTVEVKNGWGVGTHIGIYGSNYLQRTVTNYAGIWGNSPEEVVYFSLVSDAAGKPADGSNSYEIHFLANDLPSAVVNAYWSVILVSVPDYRVVPNDLKRYNFNSNSNLTAEADGSLKVAIGPKPVKGIPETNWLPAPEGKPFSLTFRAYVPKDIVRQGRWVPPVVEEVR